MAPILEAKALFERHGLNFEEQLGWYLSNGMVIAGSDYFIMFKGIEASKGDDQWMASNPDCWYIHCAIGNLRHLLNKAPYALPLIAFRRWKAKGNPLRVYDWKALARLS